VSLARIDNTVAHGFTWSVCFFGPFASLVSLLLWLVCFFGQFASLVSLLLWSVRFFGQFASLVSLLLSAVSKRTNSFGQLG
jgi:hypothetical protein